MPNTVATRNVLEILGKALSEIEANLHLELGQSIPASSLSLIAQYAIGIGPESLVSQTIKVFGFNHSGDLAKIRYLGFTEKCCWKE